MPLRIFRVRVVSAANLIQALMVAGLFGMFFLGALYLQRVLGYDAIEVGLAFLPVALAIGILSLGVSARLIVRFGGQATLVPGLVLVAAGLVLFGQAPVDAEYLSDILPSMLLLGIGAGLSFPSLMTLAMSGATASDSGLASGLVNTTQQVGGALGLAVLATMATTRTDTLSESGEPASAGAHRRIPPRLRDRGRDWWAWRCCWQSRCCPARPGRPRTPWSRRARSTARRWPPIGRPWIRRRKKRRSRRRTGADERQPVLGSNRLAPGIEA